MERKSISYHNKVRNGYLSIARKDPKRVKVLSSIREIGRTQEEIRKAALKICH